MPGFFVGYGRNDSGRIAAWTAHYVSKGCHPIKAARVASDKCHRSTTWPPVQ